MKIVNRKNEKFEVLFDDGKYCIVWAMARFL